MMKGKATTFSIFVLATFSPLSLSKPAHGGNNVFHFDYGLNDMSPKAPPPFLSMPLMESGTDYSGNLMEQQSPGGQSPGGTDYGGNLMEQQSPGGTDYAGNLMEQQSPGGTDYGSNLMEQQSPGGQCSYNCNGWPYQHCKVSKESSNGLSWQSGWGTCIAPYPRNPPQINQHGQKVKFTNYPQCNGVPDGCNRCDDECARREGKSGKDEY